MTMDAEKSHSTLKKALLGGCLMETTFGFLLVASLPVAYPMLKDFFDGNGTDADLVIRINCVAYVCMTLSGLYGIYTSLDTSRTGVSPARHRLLVHIKLWLEVAFWVYGALNGVLVALLLYQVENGILLAWIWKALFAIPSLIFQTLWTRTWWIYLLYINSEISDELLATGGEVGYSAVSEPLLHTPSAGAADAAGQAHAADDLPPGKV